MKIKSQIPNIITLLNLFCGCVALVFISENKFEMAFYFVCLGIFFDFFDGFFARKFNASGPLGLQLDSLADMVTSGVVPGFAMYKILSNDYMLGPQSYLPFLGFIITLGSCFRLAKFNIDTRQTDSFIGLPTPANCLFIISLTLIDFGNIFSNSTYLCYLLIAISFLSALIMNTELLLFALKFKKLNIKDNLLQISFLIISVLLLFFFQFLGVALVIVFYVILSVFINAFAKNKSV